MNANEKELDEVCKYLSKPIKLTRLQALIEKDKNGIYISNEQAKELLEALDEMRKCINQAYIRTVYNTATKSNMMELEEISYNEYNKLYKALGGKE